MNRRRFILSMLGAAAMAPYGRALRSPLTISEDGPDLTSAPLLFKRTGEPVGTPAQILMVGDVSMARGTAEAIAAQAGNFDYPLAEVSAWLRAADLAVGNQEGVIAPLGSGVERPMGYRLRADPPAAAALAKAGFGLMSLANNHTRDFGPEGIRLTIQALTDAGIQHIGAGENYADARKPVVTAIKGVRIGWIAYTQVPDPPDYGVYYEGSGYGRARLEEAKLPAQIRAAREGVDVLIAQFHWGIEYDRYPYETQIRQARLAVQSGASLVIGHHPHVTQTTEIYADTLIAYSLGNFLFDQLGRSGMGIWIRIDKGGILDVHQLDLAPGVHPVWQTAV